MIYRRIALIAVPAVALGSAAAVYTSTTVTSGTDDTVAVPVPAARVAGYCRSLHAELPSRIDGLPRHDLKPHSELIAGWGTPSIVLRCGVPRPPLLNNADADAITVDGVDWVIDKQPDGVFRLITTLRRAYVEVTLPKRWAEDVGPLIDLAGAVRKSDPRVV